ncbi:hypothetical protein JL475_00645 [Streptomyces sp. M2CJ-2]|uniref:putative phage holin n=1 Tax=Streptomyces sp. M2CJ-2 TaxID=2803948 RepID=UPI001922B5BE|nr:hypothetical protein [Streptomyces sp. M2CJ-2]MBL3664555.1 hypothetical protein [Streptomyces sp. M2CJ-2]
MRDLRADQWINVSASMLAVLACAVFVITYHYKAFWWRSEVGRNLMGFAAAVGMLCLYTVLVTMWPDGHFAIVARAIRTAILLAVAALMVQRTRMLLKAQREHYETGA